MIIINIAIDVFFLYSYNFSVRRIHVKKQNDENFVAHKKKKKVKYDQNRKSPTEFEFSTFDGQEESWRK